MPCRVHPEQSSPPAVAPADADNPPARGCVIVRSVRTGQRRSTGLGPRPHAAGWRPISANQCRPQPKQERRIQGGIGYADPKPSPPGLMTCRPRRPRWMQLLDARSRLRLAAPDVAPISDVRNQDAIGQTGWRPLRGGDAVADLVATIAQPWSPLVTSSPPSRPALVVQMLAILEGHLRHRTDRQPIAADPCVAGRSTCN